MTCGTRSIVAKLGTNKWAAEATWPGDSPAERLISFSEARASIFELQTHFFQWFKECPHPFQMSSEGQQSKQHSDSQFRSP